MQNPFNFVDSGEKAGLVGKFGLDRNPFEPHDDEDGPFYTGHLESVVSELGDWVQNGLSSEAVTPLTLRGTIGSGKTRILRALQTGLDRTSVSASSRPKVLVYHAMLNKAGYTRPNVSAFLLTAIEQYRSQDPDAPASVLPLLWDVAKVGVEDTGEGLVAARISRINGLPEDQKREFLGLLSMYLRGGSVSHTKGQLIGLYGKLDGEGTLVESLVDFLKVARSAGVISKLFLFIDQLEDLMRPSFSELRRARILEDLRTLIDYCDQGAPVALIMSWSPELDYADKNWVERTMEQQYMAFFSRARRRMVQVPLLSLIQVPDFAKTYCDWAVGRSQSGNQNTASYDYRRIEEIALKATFSLRDKGTAKGDEVVPRDVLKALKDEYDKAEA